MSEVEMAGDGSQTYSPFVVALTREEGKNDKLHKALLSSERIDQIRDTSGLQILIHEIPCIEHANGPDIEKLSPTISSSQFDYVTITSPEAAKVMASAWIEAGRPKLGSVAAVGKATQEALTEFGIDVAFVPSKATAATLVKELPLSDAAVDEGRATTVFYPASAKAQDTLQNGLEERGFTVLRLNTYDTIPASWSADTISLARSTTVACFASPSAIKAWLKNTAEFDTPQALASCIGETSASACRKNEWEEQNIFYPEKPGVDGWAVAVADALETLVENNVDLVAAMPVYQVKPTLCFEMKEALLRGNPNI
eukprot:CAMPEP_0181103132 /NCGR_PEP_ID=MMETSP1071-20121207/14699_1 /TAXON_ID=35127 /ORGANISM="Thalassiosira sp., Strain NH16" /LENGTH=311 /DNA_ID=CAMNT_0023186179 /DNA_START=189 /DNA_END=1125 /DNA_ORIENTATION=+